MSKFVLKMHTLTHHSIHRSTKKKDEKKERMKSKTKQGTATTTHGNICIYFFLVSAALARAYVSVVRKAK